MCESSILSKNFDFLDQLNEEQKQAALTTQGSVLVLAGAGTGKTHTLTSRIAYIFKKELCKNYQILGITFTNKAAFSIKERVQKILSSDISFPWIGTFHYVGAKILRQYAHLANLSSNFNIADDDISINIIQKLLKKRQLISIKEIAKLIFYCIDFWKTQGLLPEAVSPQRGKYYFYEKDEELQEYVSLAREIFFDYQEHLRKCNLCDFNDLLLIPINFLQNSENRDILIRYHNQFRYILVDEYQDINTLQYLFIKLLTNREDQRTTNLFCVGDDDQTIYQWRGAKIEFILNFEKSFGKSTIIKLEKNYRSTKHILSSASHLISHNQSRYGKNLYAQENNSNAEKVYIRSSDSEQDEAENIGCEILKLYHEGYKFKDMAILFRTSRQTHPFENVFLKSNIPYHIAQNLHLYNKKTSKDIISYLKLIYNLKDDQAFERAIKTPKRGFGDKTREKINYYAGKYQLSSFETLEFLLSQNFFKGDSFKKFSTFVKQIKEWKKFSASMLIDDLIKKILDESGYKAQYKDKDKENIDSFVAYAKDFKKLDDLVENFTLKSSTSHSKKEDVVNIMSFHASKGLEFDVVFLPGWEENIFPNKKSIEENFLPDSNKTSSKRIEEERRLAYVGMTRARKKLYIWFSKKRLWYGETNYFDPSRFLSELPKEHIDISSQLSAQIFKRDEFPLKTEEDSFFRKSTSFKLQISQNSKNFQIGDKVFHIKFRQGTILSIEGYKLEIEFQDAGVKKVHSNYVTKLCSIP